MTPLTKASIEDYFRYVLAHPKADGFTMHEGELVRDALIKYRYWEIVRAKLRDEFATNRDIASDATAFESAIGSIWIAAFQMGREYENRRLRI